MVAGSFLTAFWKTGLHRTSSSSSLWIARLSVAVELVVFDVLADGLGGGDAAANVGGGNRGEFIVQAWLSLTYCSVGLSVDMPTHTP